MIEKDENINNDPQVDLNNIAKEESITENVVLSNDKEDQELDSLYVDSKETNENQELVPKDNVRETPTLGQNTQDLNYNLKRISNGKFQGIFRNLILIVISSLLMASLVAMSSNYYDTIFTRFLNMTSTFAIISVFLFLIIIFNFFNFMSSLRSLSHQVKFKELLLYSSSIICIGFNVFALYKFVNYYFVINSKHEMPTLSLGLILVSILLYLINIVVIAKRDIKDYRVYSKRTPLFRIMTSFIASLAIFVSVLSLIYYIKNCGVVLYNFPIVPLSSLKVEFLLLSIISLSVAIVVLSIKVSNTKGSIKKFFLPFSLMVILSSLISIFLSTIFIDFLEKSKYLLNLHNKGINLFLYYISAIVIIIVLLSILSLISIIITFKSIKERKGFRLLFILLFLFGFIFTYLGLIGYYGSKELNITTTTLTFDFPKNVSGIKDSSKSNEDSTTFEVSLNKEKLLRENKKATKEESELLSSVFIEGSQKPLHNRTIKEQMENKDEKIYINDVDNSNDKFILTYYGSLDPKILIDNHIYLSSSSINELTKKYTYNSADSRKNITSLKDFTDQQLTNFSNSIYQDLLKDEKQPLEILAITKDSFFLSDIKKNDDSLDLVFSFKPTITGNLTAFLPNITFEIVTVEVSDLYLLDNKVVYKIDSIKWMKNLDNVSKLSI